MTVVFTKQIANHTVCCLGKMGALFWTCKRLASKMSTNMLLVIKTLIFGSLNTGKGEALYKIRTKFKKYTMVTVETAS